MIGKCDFCEKENIEIWDINEFFLFYPKETWQHNVCDDCLTEMEKIASESETIYEDEEL